MSSDNIKSGFRAAGLVPFDPEHVIAKLEVPPLVPTPTVSPLSSGPSLTPPAKTPRTTREVTRQSRYLQKKINNYQGSSPSKILKALEFTTKSQMTLLHEVALLKKENSQLRETNHMLSKRRRAKNKRLQEGGTLTIKEGQALLTQKESGSKQSQSAQKKGGRRKRVKTKERKCSNCGKPGHNARTCEKDIKMSSEKDSD